LIFNGFPAHSANPCNIVLQDRRVIFLCLALGRLSFGNRPADGTAVIRPAQLGYLIEGIDWRLANAAKNLASTSAG
jgi:hypothetical protein